MSSIADKIIEIVAAQLKRDPSTLTLETDLAEAGYESLDVIETIFAIEEEWQIAIDYNANQGSVEQFSTIGSVVRLVEAELAKQGRV